MATILVVDDEIGIRELLSEILDDEGHEVLLAENAAKARLHYAQQVIDLVLLDIWMPDTDGMTLLREWASASTLRSHVVMMSGHASIDTAVEAQNLGAVGFLEKPITLHKLLGTVHKVLRKNIERVEQNVININSNNGNGNGDGSANSAEFSSVIASSVLEGLLVSNQDNTLNKTPASFASIQSDLSTALTLSDATSVSGVISSEFINDVSTASVVNIENIELPPLSTWQQALADTPLDTGLREFRETVERVYFNYILEREHWSMIRVAEAAGLERTHLYRKLKQLNIELPRKVKLTEN